MIDTINLKDISHENIHLRKNKANEDLGCLHPNGHRLTNQLRWFKLCRDKGLIWYKNAS